MFEFLSFKCNNSGFWGHFHKYKFTYIQFQFQFLIKFPICLNFLVLNPKIVNNNTQKQSEKIRVGIQFGKQIGEHNKNVTAIFTIAAKCIFYAIVERYKFSTSYSISVAHLSKITTVQIVSVQHIILHIITCTQVFVEYSSVRPRHLIKNAYYFNTGIGFTIKNTFRKVILLHAPINNVGVISQNMLPNSLDRILLVQH